MYSSLSQLVKAYIGLTNILCNFYQKVCYLKKMFSGFLYHNLLLLNTRRKKRKVIYFKQDAFKPLFVHISACVCGMLAPKRLDWSWIEFKDIDLAV